ncbi:hypothetical protein BpHYR1_034824 [Brachionus plicatilis]|uniref:Uncharacterized protein n=1 Tax=Brachionus plicatilis TaxID=10195 RepID=A0A3M7S8A6_BRAPC|nr:hypothetical protein BpHYR1_034824 [Brachionus plicatilis]
MLGCLAFLPSDLVIEAFYFEEIYIGVKERGRYGNRKEPKTQFYYGIVINVLNLACRNLSIISF